MAKYPVMYILGALRLSKKILVFLQTNILVQPYSTLYIAMCLFASRYQKICSTALCPVMLQTDPFNLSKSARFIA